MKGLAIEEAYDGMDAYDKCCNFHFDLVFINDGLPGMSGLDTCNKIYKQ
jgi:DNA-binding response OmpR family regulator